MKMLGIQRFPKQTPEDHRRLWFEKNKDRIAYIYANMFPRELNIPFEVFANFAYCSSSSGRENFLKNNSRK